MLVHLLSDFDYSERIRFCTTQSDTFDRSRIYAYAVPEQSHIMYTDRYKKPALQIDLAK